jgi:hypothetical protein
MMSSSAPSPMYMAASYPPYGVRKLTLSQSPATESV